MHAENGFIVEKNTEKLRNDNFHDPSCILQSRNEDVSNILLVSSVGPCVKLMGRQFVLLSCNQFSSNNTLYSFFLFFEMSVNSSAFLNKAQCTSNIVLRSKHTDMSL